jgi:hypothetical protein
MSKKCPRDTLEQAKLIANGWAQFDGETPIGGLTQAGLQEQINTVISIDDRIIGLEAQLTNMRNERDAAYEELWDYAKRSRMGIKVFYGDDSSQYEMVGGTRLSDRKPVARKGTTTA